MQATIKVEHIQPFIQATSLTFTTMVKSEAKPGKMRLQSGNATHHDVSGIIGLSGGAKGSVALSFPQLTALNVISAFIGEKMTALDKDALDAIGELANIVAGSAKQDLSKYKIMISLPTVITGSNHTLSGPSNIPELIVPFETVYGPFDLLVCFKSEL
jgi:chemotaxis protein CheX